eukprot:7955875-Karenia_brevis.AAC.1
MASGGPSGASWHQRPPLTRSKPNLLMSDMVTISSSRMSPATQASPWSGLCCIVHVELAPEKWCAMRYSTALLHPT